MVGGIRPYFGSKCTLTKEIEKYLPKDIKQRIFLDVFTGGGSVALLGAKHCKKVYANDIDFNNINYFQHLKDKEFPQYVTEQLKLETKEGLYYKYKELDGTATRKNAYNMFCSANIGYGGKSYTTPSKQKLEKLFARNWDKILNEKRELIKNITFFSEDYKDFLRNCSKIKGKKFYYFDPPYYEVASKTYYGNKGEFHKNFDHEEFYNMVSKISRTPFMISYEDSPYIRDLYKNYNIIPIVNEKAQNVKGKVTQKKKELLITNY